MLKVQNILCDNSSTKRCPLCHAKQSEFDKNKPFNTVEDALRTGLCLLHFGPRAMEWFLNIGKNQGNFKNSKINTAANYN